MAARKLQMEIDKCFKKVSEGVAAFEAIHEKIQQTGNPAQKEKLEDLVESVKRLERDLLQKTDTLLFLTANTYIRNAMVCLPPMAMQ